MSLRTASPRTTAPTAPNPAAVALDEPRPAYTPDVRYVLLLGLMCALPAVSVDIYLPSLPEVAGDLGTTATMAQLTMTAMLIGGAVGQLVIGPLADRFVGWAASRLMSRLMLVIGVAPLFAPSIGGLIAGELGWRAVFGALALFGAALWVVVWFRMPETLPRERRRVGGLRTALAG